MMRRVILLLATWFGAGYSPVAPGTAGTLGAIPLLLLYSLLTAVMYGAGLGALALLACWVAGRAEEILGEKDSRPIVIDEVVGFLVTMAYVPITWVHVLMGFVLFRGFDIAKPFPIRMMERNISGGWGIVMDDVVAGIYAQATLRILVSALDVVS